MDRLRQTVSSSADVTQLLGLDSRFVQAELQMVKSIGTGEAITHHLEPSYYAAMVRAARAEGLFLKNGNGLGGTESGGGGGDAGGNSAADADERDEIQEMLKAAGIEVTPPPRP